MTKYAEIIIPLPPAHTFTYRIPEAMVSFITVYSRVAVPFGKKHYYTGIVAEIHEKTPDASFEIREITALLDEKPAIRPGQLPFWQWIASYYLCSIGEVCRAALPSGLKIESETVITANPEYEASGQLKPGEQKILAALSPSGHLSVSGLERATGLKNIFSAIHSLLEKGAVEISESLKQGFRSKTETYVRLAGNAEIETVLASLKRTKQQEQLLLDYLALGGTVHMPPGTGTAGSADDTGRGVPVLKKKLLACSGIKSHALNSLVKKGILVTEEKTVSRIESTDSGGTGNLSVLSETQQKACEDITKSFETKNITLLHGVTSSGKTEIYLHLISDMLSKGRQVLYLLPEIAITTQVTERLRRVFGRQLLVYHSGFSDNERVEIWNRLLHSDEPVVVLGIRSSIFLPYACLGLVIVDEEQDPSYKQQDPAPRYHARNAAMMLALAHGGKVLLGSATPSLESYLWASNGKYGLVKLERRYGDGALPEINIVDVKELRRRKQMKETLFSPLLQEKIATALSKQEQVILFRNRRGFAPLMTCPACGGIPHCIHCDVSLTYHKQLHRLSCHYCGYSIPLPSKCPSCGNPELAMQGFGTEKVEEEISALFPSAKTARLDTDTARTRSAYRRILTDFEAGKVQILIGTQAVAKGFDFENVSVVGILSAEGLLNIPDFRAYERAFQLMLQVSGRAGRRDRQGVVVLQTSQSGSLLLKQVCNFDYPGMAQTQLEERYLFHYPPYTRLILIILRSRNEEALDRIANEYSVRLKAFFGKGVSDPVYPPVSRVRSFHIRRIMLKTDISAPVAETRNALERVRSEVQKNPLSGQVILHYDVDPQ
ncbi:MAG: primosomal protein N' [Tannerella sp.]|jgi:primosomal protein N' (replication factor Y)|nr:primosomal protein N' [Tannerella sp.]